VSAVIEHIDSGADLNGTTNDSSTGADQPAVSDVPGGDIEGQRASENGASAAGAVRVDSEGAATASGNGAPDTGAGDAKDKLVPLSALHESRETIKALKTQIAALESQPKLSAEDAELLKDLRAQKQAAQAPKEPDFLEDPKGYVDANVKKTAKELETLREESRRGQEQQAQQQQLNQILSGVHQHEQSFVKATPDYHQAVDHIRTVRASQLQMLYPQATPQQIQQQIVSEEIGAAAQVLRAGGNPAEFAYNYAKTVGYQPKAPVPDPNAPANGAAKPDKDAVRSMGGGGGAEKDDSDEGAAMPELAQALAERFGVRKRK
jgi:hypothetical protein